MMRPRLFPRLILLAVFLAACAPATSTAPPALPDVLAETVTPSPLAATETPSVDLTATYTEELLSATPPVGAQPIATSRGPNLEATDPATVNLASGGLQLVEFFRFT